MICGGCGQSSENSGDRFCATCGKSLQSPSCTQFSAKDKKSLYSKWAQPYYRGTVKSLETPEIWVYDRCSVKCQEGNPKGSTFVWTGSEFVSENPELGFATWDGNRVEWRFPFYQKHSFYSYVWNTESQTWKNENGMLRSHPIQYTTFVHWKLEEERLRTVDGSDFKEGTSSTWEALGDIPPPVFLIVAMYSRAQKLLEEAIARSKRQYRRCGKVVLATDTVSSVFLCCNCNDGNCIVCDRPAQPFQGRLCKMCTSRKNFCVKCSDPLNGSRKQGFLCGDCGLGKANNNCCKMIFN